MSAGNRDLPQLNSLTTTGHRSGPDHATLDHFHDAPVHACHGGHRRSYLRRRAGPPRTRRRRAPRRAKCADTGPSEHRRTAPGHGARLAYLLAERGRLGPAYYPHLETPRWIEGGADPVARAAAG